MRLSDGEWEKVKCYVKEVRGGVEMQPSVKTPAAPPSPAEPSQQAMAEKEDGYLKKIEDLEKQNDELTEKLEQCEAANADLKAKAETVPVPRPLPPIPPPPNIATWKPGDMLPSRDGRAPILKPSQQKK